MDREGKKGKDKGEGRTEAEIKKEEGEKGKGKNWMKTRGEEKKENKGEEKNEQETKKNRERIGIRSKKNKKKTLPNITGEYETQRVQSDRLII